jgi:hypothetical protein
VTAVAEFHKLLEQGSREALDAGVFYDRDFDAFVRGRYGKDDPAVENHLGIRAVPLGLPREREILQGIEQELQKAPRGTWVTLCKSYERDGKQNVFYNALYSDGTGTVATGSKHDHYGEAPTYEAVYARVLGYEIYEARKRVEAADRLKANMEAVESGRVAVGSIFKDVHVNNQKFSKAEVISVDADAGTAQVRLTKQGSRRRWDANVPAAGLSPAPKDEPVDAGGAPTT